RTVFKQLKQFGHLRRQEIGISMQTITPPMAASLKLARTYGGIVSAACPGGPAAAAGLKVGDILVSVDGQPAENLPTVSYNFRLRDSKEPVKLVVFRAGSEVSLSIAPVEQGDDFDNVSVAADPEKSLVSELGILGVEIDSTIAAASPALRDPFGIIVVAKTMSADTPLQPKDVIRSLNNQQTYTLQALRNVLAGLSRGSAVVVQVQRAGPLMFGPFTLE